MVNGRPSISIRYRREGETWTLVEATVDSNITTLLGEEVFRAPAASVAPHRVHTRTVLDALAKMSLDGGSIFEEVTRTSYKAEIEVHAKSER